MLNEHGQPVGEPVDLSLPVPFPDPVELVGRTCRVVPLDTAAHADGLFDAFGAAPDERNWTYLTVDAPADRAGFRARLVGLAEPSFDHVPFAVVDADGPCGMASYLRIFPAAASIEVGGIHFSPRLARTVASTEAMFLMMRHAFELGYRRCEWKCDSLNAPSRSAATRLGFRFEGEFRQAMVTKGRNRDTTWFSMLDSEWPSRRAEFERWLAPSNFDDTGVQRTPLRHAI